MKLRNKLTVALCLTLTACLAAPALLPEPFALVSSAQAAAKVKLNKTRATVYNGSRLQLKVTGTKGKVKWTSSAGKVAAVNDKGLVTAKKPGNATITAKIGKKTLTCRVTVKSPLTASGTQLTLAKGKTANIKITWMLTGKVFMKWDNSSVMNCQFSGGWKNKATTLRIKALSPGRSTIILSNSKTKDTVKIVVTVPKATSEQFELSAFMGTTVEAANAALPDALEPAQIGYENQIFSVRENSLGRINEIALYGDGDYRLLSVCPGMKRAEAEALLAGQGWLPRDNVFVSDSDTAHAVGLETSDDGAVTCIVYFTP